MFFVIFEQEKLLFFQDGTTLFYILITVLTKSSLRVSSTCIKELAFSWTCLTIKYTQIIMISSLKLR